MKKKIQFLVVIFSIFFAVFANAQGPEFITVWKTDIPTVPASSNTQIVFPGLGTNYTIQWEEQGNPANNGTLTGNDATLIEFGAVGTYIVKVTPGAGSFTGLGLTESRLRLIGLTQWGTAVAWMKLENGFGGCENLDITATDIPVFDASLTSLAGLFSNCTSLVWNPSVNNWDVSSVSNMASMFSSAILFNQPLNDWDVRKLENASNMFFGAASFNQPLDRWEVSSLRQFGEGFIYSTSMSCVNYSKTLIGWANNPNTVNGGDDIFISLFTDLFYGNNGAIARDALIAKGWIIDGDTFDPACDAALPVGFGNISAILRGSTLWVNWQTLSETNVSHFDIMASADGKIFTKIGTVDSKAQNGNSNIELSYSFSRAVNNSLMVAGVLLLLSGGLFLPLSRKRKLLFGGLMLLGVGFFATGCSKKDNATVQQGKVYVQIVQVDKDGTKSSSKIVLAVKD